MSVQTVYNRLSHPFDQTHTDVRGGIEVTFVTGEQVISRLNEVLGVNGWNFKVLHQDIHPEADEIWVLGEINATIEGVTVTHQQFGSQKIKRSRSTGSPLDIGFDFKGAATDSMKKCASYLGVALYLTVKPVRGRSQPSTPRQTPEHRPAPSNLAQAKPAKIICKDCGGEVQDHGDKPRHVIATEANAQFKRTLCWDCYQKAAV